MLTALNQHGIERFCTQQNQVSAYFTSVQILSVEKQEGGSDISVKEVYTCFTSEKIQPFGSAMAGRAS